MEWTEWELVPLVQQDRQHLARSLAQEVLTLDALLATDPDQVSCAEKERLVELHRRINHCVVSPCEAAKAPCLSTRPGFLEEAMEAFHEFEPDGVLPVEQFLALVGDERDCSRCEGATSYPGVSGVPCDLDTTMLREWVKGTPMDDFIEFELVPEEMATLADELSEWLMRGHHNEHPKIPVNYIKEVVEYLRYWARLGFGVAPIFSDSAQ